MSLVKRLRLGKPLPRFNVKVPVENVIPPVFIDIYLTKEKARLESEVARVEKKLANQGFVAKAPQKLVDEEKAKGEKYREMLAVVIARLDSLK